MLQKYEDRYPGKASSSSNPLSIWPEEEDDDTCNRVQVYGDTFTAEVDQEMKVSRMVDRYGCTADKASKVLKLSAWDLSIAVDYFDALQL